MGTSLPDERELLNLRTTKRAYCGVEGDYK